MYVRSAGVRVTQRELDRSTLPPSPTSHIDRSVLPPTNHVDQSTQRTAVQQQFTYPDSFLRYLGLGLSYFGNEKSLPLTLS